MTIKTSVFNLKNEKSLTKLPVTQSVQSPCLGFANCSALHIPVTNSDIYLVHSILARVPFQRHNSKIDYLEWENTCISILTLEYSRRMKPSVKYLSRNPYLKNCISVATKQKHGKETGLDSRLSRVATNVAINICVKIVR